MEKVDIRVKKTKTAYFDGPFYVREFDPDSIMEFFDRISKPDAQENNIMVQMTLCGPDKKPLFEPKHINLLKGKFSGVDWLKLLMVTKNVNPLSELNDLQDKYLKNSESDLVAD